MSRRLERFREKIWCKTKLSIKSPYFFWTSSS